MAFFVIPALLRRKVPDVTDFVPAKLPSSNLPSELDVVQYALFLKNGRTDVALASKEIGKNNT